MHRAILLLCSLLVFNAAGVSKLVPIKDYREGILDAEFVCIVSQTAPGNFQVEEVFLSTGPDVDSVQLPGFRLATPQEYGPDIVEPITPSTRILLYLRHKKDAPSHWEIIYFGHSFFWVQNPGQTQHLRDLAAKGVDLRRRWEEARETRDPARGAEALWPFLSIEKFGPDVVNHTLVALKKIAPASGDYFADHFDDTSTNDLMNLLADAGEYGGDKLHEKVKDLIPIHQRIYESYAVAHDLEGHPSQAAWNNMPETVRNSYGYIYYGAAGLASFNRRDDLVQFREIGRWGVKYGLEQPCEAALAAFRAMPDEENLPVIALMRERFKKGVDGVVTSEPDGLLKYETLAALKTHIYVKTVPQLVPFLSNDSFGDEAEDALTRIVGRDLGRKPGPWLSWYQAR